MGVVYKTYSLWPITCKQLNTSTPYTIILMACIVGFPYDVVGLSSLWECCGLWDKHCSHLICEKRATDNYDLKVGNQIKVQHKYTIQLVINGSITLASLSWARRSTSDYVGLLLQCTLVRIQICENTLGFLRGSGAHVFFFRVGPLRLSLRNGSDPKAFSSEMGLPQKPSPPKWVGAWCHQGLPHAEDEEDD